MRAISIRVDDVVGVSGFVLPGDRVDILLTRRVTTGTDALQTQTLLQNIKIVGIDQSADQAADKPVVAHTATVEVTPEQAQKLILAQQAGSLSLALRSVESTDNVTTGPISERDLGNVPRPAPAAAPVVRVVGAPPPPAAVPTVRVRYGDGSTVDKVIRP
jgi:pilus assembly protein CpaB